MPTTRKPTAARKPAAKTTARRPEADVTDGLRRPARKAATTATGLTAKAEAKLLADIAEVDTEIRRISALREQRTALLLKARAANISYSRLAEAMGGIPTGNVHAIVKAAAS